MATITRGNRDELVERVKRALDEYETHHSGAVANLYRQNSGAVRIRIIDGSFSGQSKGSRHDHAWNFIADRLNDDDIQEISLLLLLAPGEQATSFMNAEFDDPVPSRI